MNKTMKYRGKTVNIETSKILNSLFLMSYSKYLNWLFAILSIHNVTFVTEKLLGMEFKHVSHAYTEIQLLLIH